MIKMINEGISSVMSKIAKKLQKGDISTPIFGSEVTSKDSDY